MIETKLPVTKSDHSIVAYTGDTVMLTSNSTYYVGFGGDGLSLESIHFKWDAAIIITITFEDSNLSVAVDSTTAGEWIQEAPTTSYIAVVGAGATASNMTITVAGGAAGGAMVHIGNFGAERMRAKLVVGATGGDLSIAPNGKAG